jgi:transmembrane sensor
MIDTNENSEPLPEALLDAAAEWLVRLNETTASHADFEEWQDWLGIDARHARAFQAVESTWRLSAQAAIAHHGRAKLGPADYRPDEPVRTWLRRHHNRRRRRALTVAAAMLVCASVLGAWWSRQPAVIQTTIAEQRLVWLPDRSKITVGPRTRVTYRYSAERRAITLNEGQAFFEVTRDLHRPFVVETGRATILAVGTAFSVDATPNRLNVTVSGGTVRIDAATAPQITVDTVGPAVLVTAGRRYVSTSNITSVTSLPSATNEVSWRDGRLAYYGDPLSAVIADLNRYTPDRIELVEPQLGELQYTGTVFPESATDWLASLPQIFPVRIEHTERGWLIAPRATEPAAAASSAR